jgi:hypothetical protein
MSSTASISKGCLWNELSESERNELKIQLVKILKYGFDGNLEKYRFRRDSNNKWTITNAMLIPLSTAKVGF